MRPDVDWHTITRCIRTRSHTQRSGRASFLASCPVCAGPWPSPGSLTCGYLFRRWERHLAMCQMTGAPRKDRPGLLQVSFADNVTILGVMPPSVCSPVLEEPTPLVSLVIMDDVFIPEGGTNEPSDVVPDVIPPPPGFPPFSWPIVSKHVAIEQSGSPLGDGVSPDVLVSHSDVDESMPLSTTWRWCMLSWMWESCRRW